MSAHQDAAQTAHQVPGGGRQQCFVEIVDVKVDLVVVALVGAEILQVQVTAAPGGRRIAYHRRVGQSGVEQMAGGAQEHKRVAAHGAVFEGQRLGVAPRIELTDLLDDVHSMGRTVAG